MELRRRGSLARCWPDVGINWKNAHHALADARAAARLPVGLLADQPRTICKRSKLPPIQWPTIPQPRKQSATREKSRRRQADPPTFLHLLLRRAHDRALPSTTDGAIMAYEALLDRVLKDRLLDDFKADTLLPTAARWGLSNDQARLAHHDYLNRIALAAVADGTIVEA
jgi:hypothetical protein